MYLQNEKASEPLEAISRRRAHIVSNRFFIGLIVCRVFALLLYANHFSLIYCSQYKMDECKMIAK